MTEVDRDFRSYAARPVAKHQAEAEALQASSRLLEHMREISADPSGSPPSLYLNDEEMETYEQFLLLAEEVGWPNADPIDMRACRIPGIPAWTSYLTAAKAGLTKALFFPKIGDEHHGYLFAHLGIAQSQPVAICSDGLLRSRRGPEPYRSMGIGWGRLPDPELMRPQLKKGYRPVDYGTKDLRDVLLKNIDLDLLPPVPTNP